MPWPPPRARRDRPARVGSAASVPTVDVPELTPAQQRTLDVLRRSGEPLVFDPELIDDVRERTRAGLDELAARLPDTEDHPVSITKHLVARVHECERAFLAPDDFSWNPARAKGQVAHRAIQLLVHWPGVPVPSDLVDEAIARLADEHWTLGEWIAGLGPADRADLRGHAVDLVIKFVESFPPLDRRWRPATESASLWPPDGRIQLRARVDLTLGVPQGRESRKVIVDLKSGRAVPRHREDLRFYALVETLAREVPPRLLCSYYLDASSAQVEEVNEGVLLSAVRRTLDAVAKVVELRYEGRPATVSPGPFCRWCPVLPDCPEGTRHLARLDDPDADHDW